MRVYLLGPVSARTGGGQPVDLGTPQQQIILAMLALQPERVVPVTRLVEAVWGGDPPRTAVKIVHGYVHRLRRALADDPVVALHTEGGGYRLDIEPTLVDLHLFRRLVRQADVTDDAGLQAELTGQALALWRGPALTGVRSQVLENIATQLGAERLGVQDHWAAARLSLGHYRACVPELTRLVEEHPAHEGLRAHLMVALAGSGQPSLALGVYRSGRHWLAEQLGVEPGAELCRLHHEILQGTVNGADDVPRWTVPRQLPRVPADFIGRDDALQRLDHLTSGPGAAVLVHGCAGVGKTALVLHWAHLHAERFPDGQIYLDLHGFDGRRKPVSVQSALTSLVRLLGGAAMRLPPDEEGQASLFRTMIAGRRVLIVLDNAASTDQVVPLLPGTAESVTVATSRRRLGGLAASAGIRRVPLDVFTPTECLTLVTRVLSRDPDTTGPASVAAVAGVAELSRLCGHLPLAVRIVADHLHDEPSLSAGALAVRLADESRRLDILATDEDDIGVRSAFAASYDVLTAPAARALRLLSLYVGPGIGTAAAAALLDQDMDSTARLLRSLCDRHLLEQTGDEQFRLHDLMKIYADERLRIEEDPLNAECARERMLCWYLGRAVAANALVAPHRPAVGAHRAPVQQVFAGYLDALAWFDRESQALVAAVHQAAEAGLHAVCWELTVAMWGYFDLRRPWADWHATHTTAIDAARQLSERGAEAILLINLGLAYYYPRHFDEALRRFREAAAIMCAIGDDVGAGIALTCIGNVHLETRDLDRAERRYQEALELFHPSHAHGMRGIALNNLAETAVLDNRPADGLRLAREAIAIHRATGNRRMESVTLPHLANALFALCRPADAREHLSTALAVSRENGDRQAEAWALHYLADSLHASGEHDTALRHWHRAIALFDALGDPQADDIRHRLAVSGSRR